MKKDYNSNRMIVVMDGLGNTPSDILGVFHFETIPTLSSPVIGSP